MPDHVDFDPNGDVVLILPRKDDDRDESTEDPGSERMGRVDDPIHVEGGTCFNGVRMRVSSRHLILVSRVFGALLSGEFTEAHVLNAVGSAEVPLPEDDSQAMEVLLNIMHGHLKNVPRDMDIGTLAQISVAN